LLFSEHQCSLNSYLVVVPRQDMWFTDSKGNKVNTENSKPGISSGQFHSKDSDVVSDTIHDKSVIDVSDFVYTDAPFWKFWDWKKHDKHCDVCGANTHESENHDAYAKAWDEKYFPKPPLNKTWVDWYGTDEDRKELERQHNKNNEFPDELTMDELDDLEDKYDSEQFGLEDDRPLNEIAKDVLNYAKKHNGIIYTQVDGEEDRVYSKGLRFVNRTGIWEVLIPNKKHDKGFDIRLTKEVGGLPSYLGGTESVKVELKHNAESGGDVTVTVGNKSKIFKDYGEAREVYSEINSKEDADRLL
jgi:hypothetical protein